MYRGKRIFLVRRMFRATILSLIQESTGNKPRC